MNVAHSTRRERRAQERLERKRMERATRRVPKLADAPAGSLAGPQRICLSSILREDDPAVVRRCLESARPFLAAWAIVDTGCTEDVRATIHDVLRGIPGQLIQRDWPDSFAVARNWALDAACETGADYALFLDADDYVVPHLSRITETGLALMPLPKLDDDVVVLQNIEGADIFARFTFARLSSELRWRGRIHEDLHLNGREIPQPFTTAFEYRIRVTRDGRASRDMAAKHAGYRELLEAELREDPMNARAKMYLGGMAARGA